MYVLGGGVLVLMFVPLLLLLVGTKCNGNIAITTSIKLHQTPS